MKSLPVALTISAIGLAFVFASPAEAAKRYKHKKSSASAHTMMHRHAAVRPTFQGGVLTGPLHNGQEYLGDDPDPNVRSYLIRDLTSRYGGGR